MEIDELGNYYKENMNQSTLAGVYCNIRSATKNLDMLLTELYTHKALNLIEFIALTETWSQGNHIMSIENFTGTAVGRTDKRGGGVAIYLRNNIIYTKLEHLSKIDDEIECVFIRTRNEIIGVLYRPPGTKIDEFLKKFEHILTILDKEKTNVYIIGDYNINLLDKLHDSVLDLDILLNCYGFMRTQTAYPTRVTDNSATLIDFIIYKGNLLTKCVNHDITDHFPISVILQSHNANEKINNTHNCNIRMINNKRIDRFTNLLNEENWVNVLNDDNTNTALSNFMSTITNYYNQCFPYKRISNNSTTIKRQNNTWITNEIKNLLTKRNKHYKLATSTGNDDHKKSANIIRNKVNKLITRAKKIYYEEQLNAAKDIKSNWNIINDLRGNSKKNHKGNHIQELIINQTSITDDTQIANHLGEYYNNAPNHILCNLSKLDTVQNNCLNLEPNMVTDTIYLTPTTNEEILTNAYKINMTTSAGIDGLHPKIMKHCIEKIVQPLKHIFNLSIMSATFPEALKMAALIPIYKGGNITTCSNYRPISILPFFAKLLERIIYERLLNFTTKHMILSEAQFGFRKGRSTDLATAELCKHITHNIDSGKFGITIFMDLTKAFDMVNHEILLNKIRNYGIRGHTEQYIRSYLSNRKFYVKVNNNYSKDYTTNRGVPQGSTLGPFLFILYINELSKYFYNGAGILYADDVSYTEFHADINELNKSINKNINMIHQWLLNNDLIVNLQKTKYLLYTKGNTLANHDCKVYINQNIIEKVTHHKFLGITIDEDMKWNQQTAQVAKKIAQAIGSIRTISHYLNTNSLTLLYYSLVHSRIIYGLLSWGNTYNTNLQKILILQKRFLRIIEKKGNRDSIMYAFKKYNILKIHQLVKYVICVFIYKSLYEKNFVFYKKDWFHFNHSVKNNHTLRNRDQLNVPAYNKRIGHNSLLSQGAKIWNNLPMELTNSKPLALFKRKLKEHLINE